MQHVYHQLKAQDKNCALKHINFICRYARWNLKSSEAAVRRSGQFPKALNDRTLLPRTLCPHEDPSLNSRLKVQCFENLLRLYPKKYAKILNPNPKALMPKPKPFLNPELSPISREPCPGDMCGYLSQHFPLLSTALHS